jgi:cobalt-zinc-cadmium efflux system outer membrane protein
MKIRHVGLYVVPLLISVGTSALASSQVTDLPPTLSLAAALELAGRQNPGLRADATLQDAARGDAITAALLPNPALLLRFEGYRGGSFLDEQEIFLEIGQEIQIAGKRSRRISVAEASTRAIGSDIENAARLLRFAVKQAYYQVVLAQSELTVTRDLLADFDRIIRLNEERFRLGEISGGDLRRVQVERFRIFDEVIATELNLKQSKASLLGLLGIPDSTLDFDVTEALAKREPLGTLPALRAEALQTRPDLKAQRHRTARTQEQLKLEQALRFPNVSPFLGYKRDFGEDTVVFGVEVPLPLFNRNQGGIVRAKAEGERESFQRQRVENQVLLEVDQTFNRFETERRRLEALESEYVPKARESREIAETAYRLGALDLSGLLDAQRAFREIRRLYSRSLYELTVAAFQVEAALGR